MFSSLESCRTNRANSRLVASSIMAIRYSFSPPFQPVVLALLPLPQFPNPAPPRSPEVYRLHLLSFRTPQFCPDHPLPQGLFAHLDVVLVGQIFRGQRRPESVIQIRGQDLHGFLLDGLRDPLIRRFSTQPLNHRLVAAFL